MACLFKIRRFSYVIGILIFNSLFRYTLSNRFRLIILKLVGVRLGKSIFISRSARFDFPWRLKIGSNCYIGANVYLDCRGGKITIGESTDISDEAVVYTLTHDIKSHDFCIKRGDVTIGDRNWLCTRSIILPGASLGTGSVLSANSVFSGVSKDFSLLVGNPAKHVKYLPENRAKNVRQHS